MNRLSDRISAAMSSVRCPGCGQLVVPTIPSSEPTGGTAPAAGRRWSLVWRPPSGQVCPECNFPLARYAKRIKWMQLFTAGVVLLTFSFLLYVLGRLTSLGSWYPWALRVMAGLGAVGFLAGLAGLIVGGRRAPPE